MKNLFSLAVPAAIFALAAPALAQNGAAQPAYRAAPAIALPDGRWDLLSFDAAHRRVIVARGDGASAVDLGPPPRVRSIGSVARGHAALAIPGSDTIAITSGGDDSLSLVGASDGLEIARIKVGANPDAMLYDPRTRHLLVMNAKDGSVSEVDPATRRVIRTIAVKPALELGALVGPRLLAINDEDANEIELVDLARGAALKPIALPGCDGPTGIAYDAEARVLLSACANGKAAVVDMRARKLRELVAIGNGPDGALFDARRRRFLVPCGRSGSLSVFAADRRGRLTRLADVPTAAGARTAALDEATGRIYLPAAVFAPAAAGQRAQIVPGTVSLVVLVPVD